VVQLFGREWTRQEMQGYVGNLAQLGGIRPMELVAGRERGVRGFEVSTGAGLSFTVLADRALDITHASYHGQSLAFLTPGGQAHPAYYESQGPGWLQTFPGGLVTTCGLSYCGAPSREDGEEFGLHGRVSALPAAEVGYWHEWQGDECWCYIKGSLTEGALFSSPLHLTRQISTQLGSNCLALDDTVENLGGQPAPHMMLYHCNFGFPFLGPATQLVTSSRQVTPRDAHAASGVTAYGVFQQPEPGYAEQCFFHEMVADNAGQVRVALINPELAGGLGIGLTYDKHSLPYFTEWKQMGYGSYVLGLEPGNCLVMGRAAERTAGRLRFLQPGESVSYHLEIAVLDSQPIIEEFVARITAVR